ncbi:ABC-2 transporter permease [Niallia sp. 03133]|uniref:ABC-2 transporter permease n=1 Tax=Niallia sp. 03133 TaxID=3458060 RepID=UPI004043F99A
MYHLIKKEILMQKKMLKSSILIMMFFSFTLSNLGPGGMILAIVSITYQLVLGASAMEDKSNSNVILISLPIKKTTIVLSKYISLYVFTAYVILVFYCIYLLVNLFHIPLHLPLTLKGIAGAIIVITLVCTINFPLVFKYGYIKSKMANLTILFIFAFGGTITINYLSEHGSLGLNQHFITFLNNVSDTKVLMFLILPILLLIILSYYISLGFYKNREF